jgi:hypothetical protein
LAGAIDGGPGSNLPVEARETILHGPLARDRCLQRQRPERERLCRIQIALAMLVVNRERFGRFADDPRRASAQLEDAAPGGSCGFVPTHSPAERRMCAQRLGADNIPIVEADL